MTVLMTGASGFVGQYALPFLQQDFNIITVSLQGIRIEDIELKNVDTILHLAGKAHQMVEIPSEEYFKVNHELTIDLAKRAKEKGVTHFIFISSVKVFGEVNNTILDESSVCNPNDPYGQSKLAAEIDLLKLADNDFFVSIIRPPLVYGPKVKGNLRNLHNLILKLPFLPFGNINNERSMVFVGNLTMLISCILKSKSQGIFIAGDRERYSTTQLVNTVLRYVESDKKNIGLPNIFWLAIRWLRPKIYNRLIDSYIVDNSKTNLKLQFTPPYSFDEGIEEMVKFF